MSESGSRSTGAVVEDPQIRQPRTFTPNVAQGVAVPIGTSHVSAGFDSQRQINVTSITAIPPASHSEGGSSHRDSASSTFTSVPSMVDSRIERLRRNLYNRLQPQQGTVRGCVPPRVGSSSGRGNNIGTVVRRRTQLAHKQPRVPSCNFGSESLDPSVEELRSVDLVGQFHGSLDDQESGNDQIQTVTRTDVPSCKHLGRKQHYGKGSTHSRLQECSGGRSVKTRKSIAYGVDASPRSIPVVMSSARSSTDRFVCNPICSGSS